MAYTVSEVQALLTPGRLCPLHCPCMQWEVPQHLQPAFSVRLPAGVLRGNERQTVTWQFTPDRLGRHDGRVRCLLVPAQQTAGQASQESAAETLSLASMAATQLESGLMEAAVPAVSLKLAGKCTKGAITLEPSSILMGTLAVGFPAARTVTLLNQSDGTLRYHLSCVAMPPGGKGAQEWGRESNLKVLSRVALPAGAGGRHHCLHASRVVSVLWSWDGVGLHFMHVGLLPSPLQGLGMRAVQRSTLHAPSDPEKSCVNCCQHMHAGSLSLAMTSRWLQQQMEQQHLLRMRPTRWHHQHRQAFLQQEQQTRLLLQQSTWSLRSHRGCCRRGPTKPYA